MKEINVKSITELIELRQKYRFIKAIDLETTGLSPVENRVIEYGSYTSDFFENKLYEVNYLVNPEESLSPKITELTHLTDDDLVNEKKFSELSTEILYDLVRNSKDTLIIIHNAKFDMGFLINEFGRLNIDLEQLDIDYLCTRNLSKELVAMGLFDNKGSNSLQHLMGVLGIEDPNHHRSINDCIMCTKLFLRLLGIINDI